MTTRASERRALERSADSVSEAISTRFAAPDLAPVSPARELTELTPQEPAWQHIRNALQILRPFAGDVYAGLERRGAVILVAEDEDDAHPDLVALGGVVGNAATILLSLERRLQLALQQLERDRADAMARLASDQADGGR